MKFTAEQTLLINTYELTIKLCNKKEKASVIKTIQVLINALNFENDAAKEISEGLLRLYLYCQEQIRLEDFERPILVLKEIKESFEKAFENIKEN